MPALAPDRDWRDRLIAEQRQRIDELEETLRQTGEQPGHPVKFALPLTVQQAALLNVLIVRSPWPSHRDWLIEKVAPGRGFKLIDVLVYRLRAKCGPHGITIHTELGVGLYLDTASRDRARNLILREAS